MILNTPYLRRSYLYRSSERKKRKDSIVSKVFLLEYMFKSRRRPVSGGSERNIIEILMQILLHAYFKTEHEVAKALPAIMAFRSINTLRRWFKNSPIYSEVRNWTPDLLAEKLIKSGFVREARFSKRKNLIVFEVKGCRYAPYIHPYIGREHLCPYVVMALLVLDRMYDEVKLAEKLPEKTDNGIRAEFEIGAVRRLI
ncbi:MAG: hypothetical protein DRJ49_03040 [Thermoprotei archaeon]|nr:MAG: hypothetical protein DRJ49_03040 [Thermoprotei archaeon]